MKKVVVAGSYRRRRETVGDLDILVTCRKDSPVMDAFVGYEDVEEVVSKGKTRSTVRLRSDFQVDLRVVPQVSYGAALHYFTGSKEHNIAIRQMGVKKGLKINEYGVFKGKDEERVAGRKEEEVYEAVGLPYIEPELRENRGEIEAAKKDRLPRLVTVDDIRGDLHAHTEGDRRPLHPGGDGGGRPGAGLRLPGHHRTQPERHRRSGPGPQASGEADRGHRRAQRPARRFSHS